MLTFLLHSPLSLLVCIHLVLVRPLALLLQVLKRQLVINILDTLEVCDEFRLPKDVVQKYVKLVKLVLFFVLLFVRAQGQHNEPSSPTTCSALLVSVCVLRACIVITYNRHLERHKR